MRATLGWLPGGAQTGWCAVLAGVVSDLIGEVGDQLRPLGQILRPKRDDHGAPPECREARAAVLGR